MYSKILGLTWVYTSSAVWLRNLFWINSQAGISTIKVFTRLISSSERVQLDGLKGREPCSGSESSETLDWLVWLPPSCFSAPPSLLSRRRDCIGPSRRTCRRGRSREIFVSSGLTVDKSRTGKPS